LTKKVRYASKATKLRRSKYVAYVLHCVVRSPFPDTLFVLYFLTGSVEVGR
jgi:hypothetical protein